MNVSSLKLYFKSRNIADLALMVMSLSALVIPFTNLEPLVINGYLEYLFVITMLLGALYLQLTNTVGVKIPVFEYNLKLISHAKVKQLLIFKCSIYGVALYLTITNIISMQRPTAIILGIAIVFYVMLSCVSRSLNSREILMLVILIGVTIQFNVYVALAIHAAYYLMSKSISLDYTSIYNMSVMMNAHLYDLNSEVTYRRKGKQSVFLRKSVSKLNVFLSRIEFSYKYLLVSIVILLISVIFFEVTTSYFIIHIIIFSKIVLEDVVKEELILYQTKVIPKQLFGFLFKINIAIYLIYLALTSIVASRLIELSLLMPLIIIICAVYHIVISTRKIRVPWSWLLDSLVFLILTLLA